MSVVVLFPFLPCDVVVIVTFSGHTHSPFDTPICPIHQPRNVEYNEVFFVSLHFRDVLELI